MADVAERRWFGLRRGRAEERALPRESGRSMLVGAPFVAGPVTARDALRLVDVYACINVIASAASTVPLVPYRRTPEGRERLVGGRLVELLRRPAPATTQSALVGQCIACLCARGNAYIACWRDADGQVVQLGVLDPDRIQVRLDAGEPFYTLTLLDGRQVELDGNDVIHVKTAMQTPDGLLGLSPLAQCAAALGLNKALADEAGSTAVNAATPKGVLTVAAGPGSDDVVENLRAGFSARHQGPENRSRIAVLTSDVSFSAVSISPHDSLLVERQRLSTQEIARLFNVPPFLVNAPLNSSLTYATSETEAMAFAKFCLSPLTTATEQAISASPLCSATTYVEFLYEALLRPDTLTRFQAYQIALGNPQSGAPGFMTRAEIRARENLPAEEA
jgi:HK97 family phage portal protein